MTLEDDLRIILERLKQDTFGGREAPCVELHDGSGENDGGELCGGFDVLIKKRDGTPGHILTHEFTAIRDREALESSFAEALSKVSACHRKWPR